MANAIPNILWSVLLIAPVFVFCYRYVPSLILYATAIASCTPYLLPKHILHRLQLSRTPATYRRLRVPLVNRVTQNGTWVVRFMQRSGVEHKQVDTQKLLRNTYTRERFHLAGFLFFLAIALDAAMLHKPMWTLLLILANVLYNLYPILLQQYLRMRVLRVRRSSQARVLAG